MIWYCRDEEDEEYKRGKWEKGDPVFYWPLSKEGEEQIELPDPRIEHSFVEFSKRNHRESHSFRSQFIKSLYYLSVAMEVVDHPIGINECQMFGRERGRLRQANKMIGDFDLLIGATALQHVVDSVD